jgi:ATP-dependent DNA helicase RecG
MPPPVDNLRKFLNLEIKRNYDNKAIVGGLDKINPVWVKDANLYNLPVDLITQISKLILAYSDLSENERPKAIIEILEILDGNSPSSSQNPRLIEKQIATPVDSPQPEIKSSSSMPKDRSLRKESQPTLKPDNQQFTGLDAPLTVLQGIGPSKASMLKSLGLETLEDLLYFFPRRYDDYSKLKPINMLTVKENVTIIATVQSGGTYKRGKPPRDITEIVVSDGTSPLRLIWWNQTWPIRTYRPGMQVVIAGRVDLYLGRFVISNPDIEQIEQEHLHTNRIVPVYPLTSGLTQKAVRKMMYEIVSFWAPRAPEYLPALIRDSAEIEGLTLALKQIHFPDNFDALELARNRLAFDEIFLVQLGVLQQKLAWQSLAADKFEVAPARYKNFVEILPFELTESQKKVMGQITRDLASSRPMNRLLQGDVGSGKTVIAGIAASIIAENGAQSAILAPTSILAIQHQNTLQRLFAKNENAVFPFRKDEIRLLIGDTPEAEKAEIREHLASGRIKLLIGTHALLEEPVLFKNLKLAVIDEQHRFGVEQRASLRYKGENPHLLVMTATPIPRSLALTVYGDLDVSIIDEMPAGRRPVETRIFYPLERERAYTFIKSQIQKGSQTFIVYPFIDQGDNDEFLSAVHEYERLQSNIFGEYQLGLLHGRLKTEEKDQVMDKFRKNEIQILVTTTVIEVGVDIPNATVMLIEAANRFGLAQLHQLRGRVGRGIENSYCLLIPDTEDAIENERLSVMVETNDGFILAEKDLEQRGPGEFLGTRQSGYTPLRMANLTDIHLIEKARKEAVSLIEHDPTLSDPSLKPLLQKVNSFWSPGKGDIS